MRLIAPRPILTALLLLITASAAADRPIDYAAIDPADHAYDHWYLDTLDGQPSGYWRAWMQVDGEQLISGYEEVGYETHDGQPMQTRVRVVWTETLDHQPLHIVVETELGSDVVRQTYRWNERGVDLTSEQNGRSIEQQLPPIQGDYLTAAQYTIALDHHLAAGDESFELKMLDPLVGMTPYTITYRKAKDVGADAPFALANGERIDASRWAVTYSILPGLETQEWIDADGRSIGLSYDLGGMTLVSRLADKKVSDTIFDPPEMARLSVVVPDRPIQQIDQQRRVVYELAYDAGVNGILPIRTARQSVEPLDDGRVRVTVDLDAEPDEERADADAPSEANLAATIRVDHEDDAVRRLAEQAVARLGDSPTPRRIAGACRRYVTRHMRAGSLSVGDATASEAARTRRGDCTESAVLLAALLRAHGVPSRCVLGLVYSTDGFAGERDVFVYHQWTQAWVEDEQGVGQWLDLDAAMWRYTAGHIALGVSDMGDNDQQDWVQLIPMQQNLTIKVIQTNP